MEISSIAAKVKKKKGYSRCSLLASNSNAY